MKTKTSCALALGLGMIASASAAVVIQPTSVLYTGTNPDSGITGLDNATAIGDGSGLSEALTVANIGTVTHANPVFSAPGNAWATDDPGAAGGDFFADATGTVVFEVTLADTFTLDTFYNWSYDFGEAKPNGNNIQTVNIEYGVGDFLGGTLNGITFSAATNDVASTAALGGITADRLRITVTDNFYDNNGTYQGGDRVGAAEFAFVGEAIPEPSSAALLGLGGIALIMRRRK